ncbi:hypothetical protein CKJ76_25230 [Mycobacterium avium]|nr:hypothetical protein CKJ76_25230 [Mycobacterium avium]
MFDKFTARARMAVVAAHEQSRSRHHDVIGTEHLLLGLIANDDDAITEIVRLCGGDPATIRASVDGLKPDGAAPNHGHIPFTARAKQTLENSLTEAQRRSHQHVDAEHLLWAVTQDPDATSSKAVTASAICIDTVRTRLEERWNDAEQHPPGGI